MNKVLSRKNLSIIISLAVILLPVVCLASFESNPLEQLDFANGLFQRKMFDMAKTEYGKFIELFPESEYISDAYLGIAECLYFQKLYDEALEKYQNYMKDFAVLENAVVAKVRIAEIYYFTKNYKEAARLFKLLARNKMNADLRQRVFFYQAKTHRARDEKEKAQEYYLKALDISDQPEYMIYSYLDLGDLAFEREKFEEARNYFDNAFNLAQEDEVKGLALYKLGETQFLSGEYSQSAFTFKSILEQYPETDLVPGSFANLLLSLFNMQEFEDLVDEYLENQEALKEEDAFCDCYFVAVSAYDKLKKSDEAMKILDFLIVSDWIGDENKEKALLKKTEILLGLKSFDLALTSIEKISYETALEKDRVLFLRGESFFGVGNFPEAAGNYNELIVNFPESVYLKDAVESMAYAQRSLGNNQEARDYFLRYYKEAKDDSKRAAALYNAILLERKIGNIKGAIENCNLYLSSFSEGDLKEKILLLLSSLHTQSGKYNKAVDIYNDFLVNNPNSGKSAEVNFLLGYNLQLDKRYDDALSYYKKVIEEKKDKDIYASALKNMALIYLSLNKEEEIAKIYDQLIMQVENNDLELESYFWLIKYYLDDEEFAEVLRIVDKALIREDADDGKKREMFYFKAEALKGSGQLEAAVENYDLVLESNQLDVFAGASSVGKGACLIELKQYDAAKKEFDNVLANNSDDNTVAMRARFELAKIEQLQKNLEQASKLYMLVAILYDDDKYCPEALINAADIFVSLGKNQEAQQAYEEIIKRYKKSSQFKKAKEQLKKLKES